jgi:hypothetical protein
VTAQEKTSDGNRDRHDSISGDSLAAPLYDNEVCLPQKHVEHCVFQQLRPIYFEQHMHKRHVRWQSA